MTTGGRGGACRVWASRKREPYRAEGRKARSLALVATGTGWRARWDRGVNPVLQLQHFPAVVFVGAAGDAGDLGGGQELRGFAAAGGCSA